MFWLHFVSETLYVLKWRNGSITVVGYRNSSRFDADITSVHRPHYGECTRGSRSSWGGGVTTCRPPVNHYTGPNVSRQSQRRLHIVRMESLKHVCCRRCCCCWPSRCWSQDYQHSSLTDDVLSDQLLLFCCLPAFRLLFAVPVSRARHKTRAFGCHVIPCMAGRVCHLHLPETVITTMHEEVL